MFYGKCAYCESKIEHIDYPHIEHYRPKSQFPEYCFDWENLLLACTICNGKEFKGANFPLTSTGEPVLNPCEDEPNNFLQFEIEEEEVSECGYIAIVKPNNERGEITEKTLGLNRLPLLRERTQHLSPYFLYIARKAAEGDTEALHLLQRASNPDFKYSAFAIALLRKHHLPTN